MVDFTLCNTKALKEESRCDPADSNGEDSEDRPSEYHKYSSKMPLSRIGTARSQKLDSEHTENNILRNTN